MVTRTTVPFAVWSDILPRGKTGLKELTNYIPKYFKLTGSGRASIYAALKVLNAKKVAIPAYTCPSVVDAIVSACAKPIFVDIDPSNLGMSPEDLIKKIGNVDSVIVDHSSGIPARIEEIIEIAGRKPVIEDCARALGSKIDGKLAGSFGLCGISSFGLSKNIFAGEGGVIFSENEKFIEKINSVKLRKSSKRDTLNSTKFFLSSLILNKYVYKYLYKHLSKKEALHDSNVKKYLRQINYMEIMFLSNQLPRYSEILKHRDSSFHMLHSLLHSTRKIETIDINQKHLYASPYFPIILDENISREKFLHCMERKGHRLSPMFKAAVYEYGGYEQFKMGRCVEAERIGKHIVWIPTTLPKSDLMHIADTISVDCL